MCEYLSAYTGINLMTFMAPDQYWKTFFFPIQCTTASHMQSFSTFMQVLRLCMRKGRGRMRIRRCSLLSELNQGYFIVASEMKAQIKDCHIAKR